MEENQEQKECKSEDLLDLNLTPDWARNDGGDQQYVTVKRSASRQDKGYAGDRRSSRRPAGKSDGRGGMSQHESLKAFKKNASAKWVSKQGERPRPAPRSEHLPLLPLQVSFIPERRGLGVIVKKISSTKRAYALPSVASLFLTKPEFYLIKIEIDESRRSDLTHLYQCKICKKIYTVKQRLLDHVALEHMDHFFKVEEVDNGPPPGNFNCVARCSMSGELIGPPNHHLYNERIQQLHASRFSHLSVEAYRSKIEMVKDEDIIEQWKQSVAIQKVYKRSDAEDGEGLSWSDAKKEVAAMAEEECCIETERAVISAVHMDALDEDELKRTVQAALQRERRFPTTLLFALRPALRHMNLHLFRDHEKSTFITAIAPHPADIDKTVSPVSDILKYIEAHPGCSPQALSEALEERQIEPKVLQSSMAWLIERGNVVQYYDDRLTLPLNRSRVMVPVDDDDSTSEVG